MRKYLTKLDENKRVYLLAFGENFNDSPTYDEPGGDAVWRVVGPNTYRHSLDPETFGAARMRAFTRIDLFVVRIR